jgi:hypothetical protein
MEVHLLSPSSCAFVLAEKLEVEPTAFNVRPAVMAVQLWMRDERVSVGRQKLSLLH